MALSGELIVEEKIARCKPRTESRDSDQSVTGAKAAFSGMRKRPGRVSCFWLETFRVFEWCRVPPIQWGATGCRRSGKSRENFLDPLCSAVTSVPAYPARGETYIKIETFRPSRPRAAPHGIAETLDTPRFRSRWSALCVSVGTAVDDVTTGRFQEQTDGAGFGITSGTEGRSASGNTQLQVDEPREPSSIDR